MAQLTGTCDIGEDTIFQLQTIKVGEKSLIRVVGKWLFENQPWNY